MIGKCAMKPHTLDEHIARQLKDPEFARAWAEGEGEYQAQRALIQARIDAGMSQRDLSRATGVPQKTISLIETGDTNPTVRTLDKLAEGMGKTLTISFVELSHCELRRETISLEV